jgi:hypothetical protein
MGVADYESLKEVSCQPLTTISGQKFETFTSTHDLFVNACCTAYGNEDFFFLLFLTSAVFYFFLFLLQ